MIPLNIGIEKKLIVLFAGLFVLAILPLGYIHLSDAIHEFESRKSAVARAALEAGQTVRVNVGNAWHDELIASDSFIQAKACRTAGSAESRLRCARQTKLHGMIPVILMLQAVRAASEPLGMQVRVAKRERPRDPQAQGTEFEISLLDEMAKTGQKEMARADLEGGRFLFAREIRADEGCLECHGSKQKTDWFGFDQEGWQVGQQVGVIVLSSPLAELEETKRQILLKTGIIASSVFLLGLLSFAGTVRRFIVKPVRQVIHAISSSSAQMAASLTEQERVAAQQATAVSETSSTMDELGSSSRQSAEQAEVAANGADKALELSRLGTLRVEENLASMEQTRAKVADIARQMMVLSEKTGQIRDVANLVAGFANETKMLAMNAAVEAVRAGEHGKGFAVLAMETRKLADESKHSASKINTLVTEVQQANNSTVMATEEGSKTVGEGMIISRNTAETFQEVEQAVAATSQGVQQIALNVRQQSVAIRQIVESMRSIHTGAKESVAGMSQVKEGIRILNKAAQSLQKMV
ncbi:MAG: methyl-accepting chemotaxis protein [Magnetococcus sp. MYC-9]